MEEAHIVVDLEAFPSESLHFTIKKKTQIVVDLEASLQRELDTLWGNANEAENFTIFRTPYNISQSKKNLFEPFVISIGPFHHGKKHLQALEEQKRRFLRDFLSRKHHISLDLCISEMELLETRTRRCYNETFNDLDSNAFVKMMLLDGCFVLEYFMKISNGNSNYFFEFGWNTRFVELDLLLLENQIPFFIVEKLFELIGYDQDARMILAKYLAFRLLPTDSIFRDLPAEIPNTIDSIVADPPAEIPDSIHSTESTDSIHPRAEIPDPPAEIHHLVHLCYHYFVPSPDRPVVLSSKGFLQRFLSRVLKRRSPHSTSRSLSEALPNSTRNISSVVIPSATELKEKGVKFTPKSNPKHMLDISFEYGVLKIPRLAITNDTMPIFANLLAFEHTKYGKEREPFASFVAFLDNLVNTPDDVIILQQCGIIENWLDSEEELAYFINQVGEGAGFGSNRYLAEIKTEVNRYIVSNWDQSRWNRQRAKLIREYFSSPWKAISVVAAFILLGLTCLQSFYAVYAYKFPPKP